MCFSQLKILDPETNEKIPAEGLGKYRDHPFKLPHFSCKQFSRFFIGNTDPLKNAKNPILFLGPIDSNFQTISWSLIVMTSSDWKKRIGYLEVPEGARIMAIAEGVDAAEELNSRLMYEQLQNKVVIVRDVDSALLLPYNCPEPAIIEKILGEERALRVNPQYFLCDPDTEENRPRPLFREYNTRHFTYLRPSIHYFVPPMYPLFYESNYHDPYKAGLLYYGKETQDCYPDDSQLPTDTAGNPITDPVEWSYTKTNQFGQQSTYFLQHKDVYEYQWQIDKGYTDIPEGYDGEHAQFCIGVDGWVWRKTSEKAVAKMDTLCFVHQKDITDQLNSRDSV